MSIMPDLRYQIDMSDIPNHSDLNISQTFDPPIYGYIVKIVPEKSEGYIFQPCMKLADVPCWASVRIVTENIPIQPLYGTFSLNFFFSS